MYNPKFKMFGFKNSYNHSFLKLSFKNQQEQQAAAETAAQAHHPAEDQYRNETESLVKAPLDEDDEGSHYNYPPSNFTDESEGKYAGGDNASIRSGSTIYIDDETYPLEEDEKKQLSMSGGDVVV